MTQQSEPTVARDSATAEAFATSWNNLPVGSVYTAEQVEDWFAPLTPADLSGRTVLELGCGNGSLMVRVADWRPAYLEGVDLGGSVLSARRNMASSTFSDWRVTQADLTTFSSDGFDIVYSIGVLHHLEEPQVGFHAVLENVKPGGRFHCWVYGREGNGLVIHLVDPIRKITSRLPWWITKYLIATPLIVPYWMYAKLLRALPRWSWLQALPLYRYSLWIAQREFAFFRHVAFDQLVTPRTWYIARSTIDEWLRDSRVEPCSSYVTFRNGNSWKFGGTKRSGP
jgi:SAM-dependent methyltransferase